MSVRCHWQGLQSVYHVPIVFGIWNYGQEGTMLQFHLWMDAAKGEASLKFYTPPCQIWLTPLYHIRSCPCFKKEISHDYFATVAVPQFQKLAIMALLLYILAINYYTKLFYVQKYFFEFWTYMNTILADNVQYKQRTSRAKSYTPWWLNFQASSEEKAGKRHAWASGSAKVPVAVLP